MAEDALDIDRYEAYSIVMWVRPDTTLKQNIFAVKEDITDPPNDYSHMLVIEEGKFLYVSGLEQEPGNYNEEFLECFSSTKLQAGRWYHVAVTVEAGKNACIFINGNADGKVVVPNGFAGLWGVVYINPPDEDGDIEGKVPSFRGAVDEFTIFRKALSEEQIRQMYLSVRQ